MNKLPSRQGSYGFNNGNVELTLAPTDIKDFDKFDTKIEFSLCNTFSNLFYLYKHENKYNIKLGPTVTFKQAEVLFNYWANTTLSKYNVNNPFGVDKYLSSSAHNDKLNSISQSFILFPGDNDVFINGVHYGNVENNSTFADKINKTSSMSATFVPSPHDGKSELSYLDSTVIVLNGPKMRYSVLVDGSELNIYRTNYIPQSFTLTLDN